MTIKCALTGLLSFAILAAMSACSTVPPDARDLLDEHTGVTVSVVGAPMEFAHEASGASGHDFLTLVAVQRDEDGQYTALLLLYRWSVFYDAARSSAEAGAGELLIDADGRPIKLQPLQHLPIGLPGPKDLFVPDTTEPALSAYVTDLETMRLIATSHELTVRLPKGSPIGAFELTQDGRPALQLFLKHLSGS